MMTSTAAPSATTSASAGTSSTTASGSPAPTSTRETEVLFDVSTARPITTTIMDYKLCESFKQLQIQAAVMVAKWRIAVLAAATVDDPKEKVSTANLPPFMYIDYKGAANYIWILSTPLPGFTREAHNEITR
ncbi:hypothetical protein BGZ96_007119 [Linnemannia gamsii]|uniref:Uncharacterized protein n=1 Tax=Linnemannia gamsii TaxID=64522 RepID=A0ABQ7K3E6_9FUNG|nr:hypothetical protein BGZ96_007119 [Linnemannia gamsii]